MEGKRGELYRFGPFLLDPAERSVFKEDNPVALTPKAFELLVVLVENNGRLLTKEELMSRLWPDAFVEESNLTQNISTLRKALGDQHGIETVPKLGYRFKAEVNKTPYIQSQLVVEEHANSRVVIETNGDVQKATRTSRVKAGFLRRNRRLLVAMFVTLLAVSVAAFAWRSHFGQTVRSRSVLSFANVTIDFGRNEENVEVERAALSRISGKRVAYSKGRFGSEKIFVKQFGANDPVKITDGPGNDWTPIWSPDDEMLAFFSDRGSDPGKEGTAIWIVPSMGGAPRRLVPLVTGGYRPFLKWWSDDGQRIYFELHSNLYVVDMNAPEPKQITYFDPTETFYRHFNVSRDEKYIAYTAMQNNQPDLWVTPMEKWDPVQVTNDKALEILPIWHPDGKSIIYSAAEEGNNRVFECYLDGSPPVQLTAGSSSEYVADIFSGSEGTSLCFIALEGESTLWALDVQKRRESPLSGGAGFILWPQVASSGRVMFQANDSIGRVTDGSVMLAPEGGKGPHTVLARNSMIASWSPTGDRVGFLRYYDKKFYIWTVSHTGSDENPVTTDEVTFPNYTMFPLEQTAIVPFSWSRNGQYLAFCARRNKIYNVYTINADGSDEKQLSNNEDEDPKITMSCALISPYDGQIAYTSKVQFNLKPYSVSVIKDSESRTLYSFPFVLRLLGWNENGNGLIVAVAEGKEKLPGVATQVKIYEIGLDETCKELRTLNNVYFPSTRLSPDRRSIAFVSSSQDEGNRIGLVTISNGTRKILTSPGDAGTYFSGLAWSPDGRTLFYTKQISRSKLYLHKLE